MYNFEEGIERRGTNCVKWDVPFITEDVTPMWIADMDFRVAPEITNSLKKVAEQGAYGYQFLSEKYYDSVVNWMKRRHHYELSKEEITFVPNVVLGLRFGIETVSDPGDEIIIMTPVYGPFYRIVRNSGRVLIESPMKNDHGYYTMDLEDFEKRITEKTKAVIICNPHNPSGRVWTKEELTKLAKVCIRHHLYILSDDIHSELVTRGHKHTFIASVSEEVRDRSIVLTSPSKAFNLASIHLANCFISNKELREKYQKIADKSFAAENSAFVEPVLIAAYDKSEEWLDELNEYIEGNLDFFVDFINREIPDLEVRKPEGTYLVWVNFAKTGIPEESLKEYLLKECQVAVNEGEFFGKEGAGFVRFNLACPRRSIKVVLEKMKEKFVL